MASEGFPLISAYALIVSGLQLLSASHGSSDKRTACASPRVTARRTLHAPRYSPSVIKILDPGGPKQESGQGSHLAAAVMAVVLSKGSEAIKAAAERPKRARAEKTRPRNPNRLTVNQHVFPLKTMEHFAQNGRLSVCLIYSDSLKSR